MAVCTGACGSEGSFAPQPGADVAPKLVTLKLTKEAPPRKSPPSAAPPDSAAPADQFCAFEGVTGNVVVDKAGNRRAGVRSMLGVVLARSRDGGAGGYDVFIGFRGSRSHDPDVIASLRHLGNPDWVTDLVLDSVSDRVVSVVGQVQGGFAAAVKTALPQAAACMRWIHEQRKAAPSRVWVTGHSLGGALATLFTSAMLIGEARDRLITGGPLASWPWATVKLVTLSAPVVGDTDFVNALNMATGVPAPAPGGPVALSAYQELIPGSLSSTLLHDVHRPAHFRVLHSLDPITTLHLQHGRKHAGITVYVDVARTVLIAAALKVRELHLASEPSLEVEQGASQTDIKHRTNAHEPALVRQCLVERLALPIDSPARLFQ